MELIRLPKAIKEELEHFKETGIPRCHICKKNWKKVKKQSGKYHSTWKANCNCIKKDLRLSVG